MLIERSISGSPVYPSRRSWASAAAVMVSKCSPTVIASIASERKCLLQTWVILGSAMSAPKAEVSPG
jgi:hypothetical protein